MGRRYFNLIWLAFLDPEFWLIILRQFWWVLVTPWLIGCLMGGFVGYKIKGRIDEK